MDLSELMRCAPSTRHFTRDDVPDEILHAVLDDARFAPSGGNRQGWRVVVIRDPQTRRALRELYVPHWDTYMERTGGAAALRSGALPPGREKMLRAADEFSRTFDAVPVHLLICVDVGALAITDAELDRPSIVGGASVYPFVQNILLGLRARELGAAFTTLLAPAEPQVRELLGLPAEIVLAGHISVGRRTDPWPTKLARNPVDSFAFAERYGEAWRST